MGARNLTSWGAYTRMVKRPSAETSVLCGRYRMTRAFDSVAFTGISATAANAYSAAIHASLAYAVWESMKDATGHAVEVDRPDLAGRCRREEALLGQLQERVSSRVERRVARVREGDTANVIPVVEALRHLQAHGDFTAHGIKLTSKRAVTLVHDLAVGTLDAVDEEFTAWVTARAWRGK